MSDTHIFTLLKRLHPHIGRRRKYQLTGLLALIILSSIAEVVSIGAVLPFLGALSSPEQVFEHRWGQGFIHFFNIEAPEELLLPLSITFAGAAIIAGLMRLLLLWIQTRVTFTVSHELGVRIYNKTLYQPYSVHTSRNSSQVINGIYSKASTISSNAILPTLTIIHTAVMLFVIMTAVVIIEPFTALMAFGGFGLLYLGIIVSTQKKLSNDSKVMAKQSNEVIKTLQEGLGGIKDVLIYGSQKTYCSVYQKADYALRRALGNTTIIAQSPRFIIEALGIVLLTILAYRLTQSTNGIIGAIPVLGSIALAAQKLLPLLQQAYQSWSTMRSGQASIEDALELLEQPSPHTTIRSPFPFKDAIQLQNLYFNYPDNSHYVLDNITLNIKKGSRVGFIGTTGSGKSTLTDIIMGLLAPTKGTLSVDGKIVDQTLTPSWQQHIAHVPQNIYLSDSSIAENIAFGVPLDEINMDLVKNAAEQAQIADTIDNLNQRYYTRIGEQGLRLSGGQRQRLGIARALYRQANVIIFDEATSALDSKTESAVMNAIQNLNKDLTILIIAHRTSTLSVCDKIVTLSNAKISSIKSYQEVSNQ